MTRNSKLRTKTREKRYGTWIWKGSLANKRRTLGRSCRDRGGRTSKRKVKLIRVCAKVKRSKNNKIMQWTRSATKSWMQTSRIRSRRSMLKKAALGTSMRNLMVSWWVKSKCSTNSKTLSQVWKEGLRFTKMSWSRFVTWEMDAGLIITSLLRSKRGNTDLQKSSLAGIITPPQMCGVSLALSLKWLLVISCSNQGKATTMTKMMTILPRWWSF